MEGGGHKKEYSVYALDTVDNYLWMSPYPCSTMSCSISFSCIILMFNNCTCCLCSHHLGWINLILILILIQHNHQTSDDVRFRMLGCKEGRWEQIKFSRNEDVEMGRREGQIGPHHKWRHQEGGARKTCRNFPGKQNTKVVWTRHEARTQPHPCDIAKTRGRPKKRWRDNIQGDMKKYQLTEYMAQYRGYWMTKKY